MGLFSRDPDDDDTDDDIDDGGSPFEGRGFILSAIVVGAVIVCGIALFVLTRGGDDPQTSPSTAPSTAAPTTVPTDGQTDGPPASPDPSDTRTPTRSPSQSSVLACKQPMNKEGADAAPAGVSWDFTNGVLVPVRENLGPSITDADGLRHCYRHSPAGAVIAILNTLAQAQDNRYLIPLVERRLVSGPGKPLMLAEARRRIASPELYTDDDRYTSGQLQYVGYKVIDYTSTRAIVSVAVEPIPDRIGEVTIIVRWQDGDWLLELRDDGQVSPTPTVLGSLDGYVRFRGS